MLWFHLAFLVSISCQNLIDISCSYQQQLLLTVGSPRGEVEHSVVTWAKCRADTGHTPVPCKAAAHTGPLQEALHSQGSWGRAEHPGLGWSGALAQGWVCAGPTWGCSRAIGTVPDNYFQTANSLSREMASCKWNSRDSEKVVNRSFRRRIGECGNKPLPFLTLSESCSAMNCL